LYEDLKLVNFVFFHFEGENECVASRLTACIYICVLRPHTLFLYLSFIRCNYYYVCVCDVLLCRQILYMKIRTWQVS